MATNSVLVFWGHPKSPNFGVQALYLGLVDMLHMALGDGAVKVTAISHLGSPINGLLPTRKALVRSLIVPNDPMRRLIRDHDVCIDLGEGDSYTDIYGLLRLEALVLSKLSVYAAGRPLLLGPQTIGPFQSLLGRSLGRLGVSGAKRAWTRDSPSQACLHDLGKRSTVVPDLAFAMEPCGQEELPVNLRHRHWDIGLNVSGFLWEHSDQVIRSNYRATVNSFLALSMAAGESILLVPHVLNLGNIDDDLAISLHLLEQHGSRNLEMVTGVSTARQAKAVIGNCGYFVAGRMHAAIAGVSSGTPTLPLAYSRKFAGVFGHLDYTTILDLRTMNALTLPDVEAWRERATVMKTQALLSAQRARVGLGDFGEQLKIDWPSE